ncbi:MAG: hypothetical protein KGN36_09485, partial [Acidobacteriota bacterium]|nr:hypothetical protein [Acidobacteriota bacterium]
WKLTLPTGWTYLEGPDLAIQVRPWLDLAAREFHSGRLPLWDPYEWAGHSLIAQVQPGVANPLNWILFAMPLSGGHIPISTLHWHWVLIHWLGAVFAYALCRDLRAGFVPALLGGCGFALAGFVGHTDWPQILMSAIWAPLVALFFLRVVRDERPAANAALAGAALGVSFLGTHHVIPTYTGLLICGLWAALVAARRRHARHFALFVAVAALVSAAQVLPSLEYSRLAIRWAGAPEPILPGERVPFSVHGEYSLKPAELLSIVLPRGATHVNPHLGLTVCALALLGLWKGRRRCAVWLGALAAGALLVALASPLYWLAWRFVPMVEKAREPAFAIAIAQLALAALAALGLSRLPRWTAPIALALFLGEAVYNAPRFSRFDRPGSYLELERAQEDVVRFLRAQPGWFRVDFDESAVPYNAGDLYGLEQFGASVPAMPLRVQRVLGHEETPRIYGVRYHAGMAPANPGQVEVFRGGSGLRVYLEPRIGEPMWSIPLAPCATAGRFRLLAREPARVAIQAEMACEGLAVVGDPYYPGWRAYLDGRRVPMQEVDGVRAVRAAAGRHTIEYRYRPLSVYLGCGLTLAGLALAAFATIVLK